MKVAEGAPMTRRIHLSAACVLLTIAATVSVSSDGPKFTSVWAAPDAAGVTFVGKNVAALVMSGDDNLRISAEEQLVRELTARGVQGIATYRMIPREETQSADRARPWFERARVDGVVALRPVSVDKQVTYAPSVWSTTSYSTLWGYYGYGWTGFYSPGGTREDTTLVIETLVYSLPLDKLLWAGVSTTTNPKEAQAFVSQLAAQAIKEMKKQRLVK
jgi:hypothetical protein